MKVSLIVPVLNEEEAIPIFYQRVRESSFLQEYEIEIVFINDGSRDKTEDIINSLALADDLVIALSFTRNFGKEPALFAGLEYATGDAMIPIDVDLQDPIEGRPQKLSATPDLSGTVLPLCPIPNSALKNAPPFKSVMPKASACAGSPA